MFQTNLVEKIKRRLVCAVTFFFRKLCLSSDEVEKCGRIRQATDDIIWPCALYAG